MIIVIYIQEIDNSNQKHYLYSILKYQAMILMNYIFVFHLDISGNDIREEHPQNKSIISDKLFVFHSDISGSDINEEHPNKKQLILVKLYEYHLDISGKDINEEQP